MRLFDIVCGQKGYELFCGVAKVKDYWHEEKPFGGAVIDPMIEKMNLYEGYQL